MCGRLDCYLQSFSKLRTDKNSKRWSADTCYRAPHKPFLLLSILDLISSGSITKNFIEPSFELAETFNGYWSKIMPSDTSALMSTPFYDLESEDFWNLVGQPGIPHKSGLTINSVKQLRALYLGAKFATDLYPLLVMMSSREKLRSLLITTYFHERVQSMLS